ncbi:alpha/beta fold hydrolase [Streptomyces sp. BG9H]|uniref:Alpha/beta fold hydrolase n=1 Tax=Streptomyces anatolicus TaxID=2675858 RepID=A0ABS6YRR4_9ACTN|nr:alpha/beta fold hydrolase [Streptomyces anatolicus]MBW5424057.1 alpha/beta fold hydrolase [Streptomyces anatolicus]
MADTDAFQAAYDALLAKWPEGTTTRTVPTPFGDTHVTVHGSDGAGDGVPLVLLPGGGATGVSWFVNAAELSRTRRVFAVDLIGEPGRSGREERRPIRTVADLTAWLDALLDGLGIPAADLAGHSYGAWIALHYALRAPGRVRRLVLLDPTQCFAGFRPGYLLRALPTLLRPSGKVTRAFLAWETRGAPLDADWLALQERAAAFPSARPVTGPRPAPASLRELRLPVLLLLAARSRAHDIRKVAARARALLPDVTVATLPDVSHHALPHARPAELDRAVTEFLASPPAP